MKLPSLEEGAVILMHALRAFVDEIEEYLEYIAEKVREVFKA